VTRAAPAVPKTSDSLPKQKKKWTGNLVADYFESDKLLVETSVAEYMSMANTQ
jgi:hypothetical protein